ERAAERILSTAVTVDDLTDVAWAEAGRLEAAHQRRTGLELVQHTDGAVEAYCVAGLAAKHADDVGKDLVVDTGVDGRLEVMHVAPDTGEVLLEFDQHTLSRRLEVVERVVGQRVAHRRRDHRTGRKLFTHRKRGFAVLIAVRLRRRARRQPGAIVVAG